MDTTEIQQFLESNGWEKTDGCKGWALDNVCSEEARRKLKTLDNPFYFKQYFRAITNYVYFYIELTGNHYFTMYWETATSWGNKRGYVPDLKVESSDELEIFLKVFLTSSQSEGYLKIFERNHPTTNPLTIQK